MKKVNKVTLIEVLAGTGIVALFGGAVLVATKLRKKTEELDEELNAIIKEEEF